MNIWEQREAARRQRIEDRRAREVAAHAGAEVFAATLAAAFEDTKNPLGQPADGGEETQQ